jgi:hypothetical protein
MAAVKIISFLGTAPKISPELLPNTAAQIANNCKLYSGDLLPYPQPVVVANTSRVGTIKTLFALRDPDTDVLKWLSWLTDVDIAVASANEDGEQRFYYTGDGAPKVSTYDLATTGAPPYPISYYDLGLPIPPDSAQLTTTAATFTQKTSSTVARDAGNIVTLVTSAAHGLRTGNTITVSGFSYRTGTYSQSGSTTITITINNHGLSNGAAITLDFTSGTATDGTFTISGVTTNTFTVIATAAATTSGDVKWDVRGFNAVNIECTVVDSTTFTYFSPGPQNTSTSTSDGKVDLGGLTQARSYVFTWMTPWEEESIASKPSANLYIKEGVITTVSNLPTVKPSGDNFVRGVRLYRTLASASGTEYFRLATLWFPTGLSRVERTTNVSKVTTLYPHNLAIDDRFKISGCSQASFDITGGIVTDVIDAYTFKYAQTAANLADTAVVAGTLYHDVSEDPPTSTARYWGDGSYNFTDDFDSRSLIDILGSDEYDAPPEELKGLTSAQNNILVGFVKNQLFFSEPGVPHAWPAKYAVTLPYDIIGIAAISGSMLVTTESYPYIVSGSDPAAGMSVARIDALYPCLNAKSMVTMGFGVVYSTHDGLAVFSPGGGPNIITKLLYNNDTWETALNPATVVAEYYGDNYIASHSTGGLVFERDEKIGGFFVDTDFTFTASWYDSITGKLYYVFGGNGDIYEWNDLTQPSVTQTWKSKVINTKDMINMGAARIIADYGDTTEVWNEVITTWNGDTDTWDAPDAVTFKLWVDKELTYTTIVNDTNIFRLPTGYRSDTFEVSVEGNVRVRAVHLAETPIGLREA